MKENIIKNYKVLFVGYLFPEQLETKIVSHENRPIQTQRFGLALLDALRNGFCDNVEVISVAPLLDFRHSRLLFGPGAKWKIDGITAVMMPYINLTGIKHLTRFIVTFFFVFQWVSKNNKYKKVIVLHGVQSCKIWGVLLAQVFSPCIVVPFLTDDLAISPSWENNALKKLRVIDLAIMKLGLKKTSGVISMTSNLAEKLAPGRSKVIIPTIQNTKSTIVFERARSFKKDSSFTIVYTGGLSYDYGTKLLLDTFQKYGHPNWSLKITGWGELENSVRDYAEKDHRVQFLGFLDSKELDELYNLADVLVNTKLTTTPFAEFAFPSKIVEYLSTGKPVVSTNLPVYDDTFKKHLIIAHSDSPEELYRCLNYVFSWNIQKRDSWRQQSVNFVKNELAPGVQGAKIRKFIDNLLI